MIPILPQVSGVTQPFAAVVASDAPDAAGFAAALAATDPFEAEQPADTAGDLVGLAIAPPLPLPLPRAAPPPCDPDLQAQAIPAVSQTVAQPAPLPPLQGQAEPPIPATSQNASHAGPLPRPLFAVIRAAADPTEGLDPPSDAAANLSVPERGQVEAAQVETAQALPAQPSLPAAPVAVLSTTTPTVAPTNTPPRALRFVSENSEAGPVLPPAAPMPRDAAPSVIQTDTRSALAEPVPAQNSQPAAPVQSAAAAPRAGMVYVNPIMVQMPSSPPLAPGVAPATRAVAAPLPAAAPNPAPLIADPDPPPAEAPKANLNPEASGTLPQDQAWLRISPAESAWATRVQTASQPAAALLPLAPAAQNVTAESAMMQPKVSPGSAQHDAETPQPVPNPLPDSPNTAQAAQMQILPLAQPNLPPQTLPAENLPKEQPLATAPPQPQEQMARKARHLAEIPADRADAPAIAEPPSAVRNDANVTRAAAVIPTPTPVTQQPMPAAVPVQLLLHAPDAALGPVEIILQPEELGHIKFQLLQNGDTVRVVLSAERPETLDMLRRHSDQLVQEFRQAGFSQASLGFDQWGQQQKSPSPPAALLSLLEDEPVAPPFAQRQTASSAAPSTARGLNLRL